MKNYKNKPDLLKASLIFTLLLFSLIFNSSFVFAQKTDFNTYFPVVGDTIRDYQFDDVADYKTSEVRISDFRGKWLVLDYWTSSCIGCIQSMPKINKMKHDFDSNTNFMLVGLYSKSKSDRSNKLKDLYSRIKQKNKLDLPIAYDSLSFELFKPMAVPFLLVINPEGILMAKTYSLDSTALSEIIKGKADIKTYAYSIGETRLVDKYQLSQPLLTSGRMANGGIDTSYYYRSVLTRATLLQPTIVVGFSKRDSLNNKLIKRGSAIAFHCPLQDLIRLSATGSNGWNFTLPELYNTYYEPLIVETADRNRIVNYNRPSGDNMFSYEINSPFFDEEKLTSILKSELENIFSIKISIEERIVPAWKIIVTDINKVNLIKSKHLVANYGSDGEIADLKGITTNDLIAHFDGPLQVGYKIEDPQIVNETNINFRIDIKLSRDHLDPKKAINELRRNGLDLIEGTIRMKCVIVRDKIE